MKVYKQEILDGVADVVKATASVAFCTQATVVDNATDSPVLEKVLAANANPKQVDLYYIKSVLVSTGWNKNDDVFQPEITFAARNTPEDKQFNFMHNENDIIGHITGSYVVDRSGNKIEGDEMPAQFDIVTEAVLYNSWSDPQNRERMSNIIAEIEQGKWFVSMECLFAGFDYDVVNPEGEHKIVARNEESAFLTKHLRAYGGTGEFDGYKIGRSLRDISFSGKGLVNKPANPRSYIIDASSDSVTDNHEEHNLSFPTGDITMADEIKNEEVEVELAAASEEIATEAEVTTVKTEEVAEAPVAEEAAPEVVEEVAPEAAPEAEVVTEEVAPEAEVVTEEVAPEAEASEEVTEEVAEEVEAEEVVEVEAEAEEETEADCGMPHDKEKKEEKKEEEKKPSKAETDETIATLEADKAELVAKIEALETELAGYKAKEAEEEKAKKMEKKTASLAEAGIEGEQAEAILALSIDDETFAAIVAALAAKVEAKEEETVEATADEEEVSESSDDTEVAEAAADAEEVSEELFEEVSSTEATLIDASEDQSEIEIARAAVSDWLTNNVLSK